LGKNKKPRKPYMTKKDSLDNDYSKKDKELGKLNIVVLGVLCVLAAGFIIYSVS